MSCGALVLGSDTPPVAEVIRHGENGLLTDFFDSKALAEKLVAALADPKAHDPLRRAARETIVQGYDLQTICLPRLVNFVEGK
jgi:glycosyltransferase involved in cell wall biosynthesis